MCKKAAILLLGLFLPALVCAQGGPFRLRGGTGQMQQLAEEIWTLQQLNALALTDAQITAILGLYTRQEPETPTELKPILDKLQTVRDTLLTGATIPAGDLNALFTEYRQALQQGRGGGREGRNREAQPEAASPLALAIWEQLTPTQKAALLGDVRQAAANNQKAERQAADRAVRAIGRLRGGDEAAWTANRDRLASCLSAGAGAPDSPARKNSRSMFGDYLDRIRKMSDVDFANKQEELASSLLALVPPGSSLTVAMAEFDTRQIQSAMQSSLLSSRAAALLEELQAKRAKPAQ